MFITEYLNDAVEKHPDKIAFVDEERSITFANVKKEAIMVANEICKLEFTRKPIAIFINDSVSCISAFLGVLYSNNFYTVIDSSQPDERFLQIIDDFKPEVIISKATDAAHVVELVKDHNIAVLSFENIINNENCETNIVDEHLSVCSSDLVCVIYTSGSTGRPKGAIMTHLALVEALKNEIQVCCFSDKAIFANHCPFSFVASVADIYGTIFLGAQSYIIPRKLFMNPVKLADYISKNKINSMVMTISAMQIIASFDVLSLSDVSALSVVFCGGSDLPNKVVEYFLRVVPHLKIIYAYGSSEALFRFWKEVKEPGESHISVGVPFDGTSALILDDNDKEVDKGTVGNLCIRGISGPFGYYRDTNLTNAVMVRNPNVYYTEYVYKTGDLARINGFGDIEIVGRTDSTVKKNGYRINLGEIDRCLYGNDLINECCCLFYENSICLYYSGDVPENMVNKYLMDRLPQYMVPDRTIKLYELPHNNNNKIDRMKLKMMIESFGSSEERDGTF